MNLISHRFTSSHRVNFRPFVRRNILTSTSVLVKDPITGLANEAIVNHYVEEPFIDKSLRAGDFALDVQLRNGVHLNECPSYLNPSSPEQYNAVMAGYINVYNHLASKAVVNEQPKTIEDKSQNVEQPKTE